MSFGQSYWSNEIPYGNVSHVAIDMIGLNTSYIRSNWCCSWIHFVRTSRNDDEGHLFLCGMCYNLNEKRWWSREATYSVYFLSAQVENMANTYNVIYRLKVLNVDTFRPRLPAAPTVLLMAGNSIHRCHNWYMDAVRVKFTLSIDIPVIIYQS